jgi:hypothetical protein
LELSDNATQPSPTVRRADLVLRVGESADAQAVVIEVQSRVDPRKSFTWPNYLTALRDRHELPCSLVVLTLDPNVEKACRKPIPIGHPGFVLEPIVVGPSRIPDDPSKVADDPMQAVLAVMAHGHGPNALELARTAIDGLQRVDETDRREYAPVVLRSLLPPTRALLEALMSKEPSYVGTFFERYVDQGIEQGLERGRQEGSHAASTQILFTILAVRWPKMDTSVLPALTESASPEALLAAVELVAKETDSPQTRNHLLSLLAPH